MPPVEALAGGIDLARGVMLWAPEDGIYPGSIVAGFWGVLPVLAGNSGGHIGGAAGGRGAAAWAGFDMLCRDSTLLDPHTLTAFENHGGRN